MSDGGRCHYCGKIRCICRVIDAMEDYIDAMEDYLGLGWNEEERHSVVSNLGEYIRQAVNREYIRQAVNQRKRKLHPASPLGDIARDQVGIRF